MEIFGLKIMSGGKSCSQSNVLKVKPKQQQLVSDLLLKATLKKSPPKVIGNFDKNFDKNFDENFDKYIDKYVDENFNKNFDENFDENFIEKPENQTVAHLMASMVCVAAFALRLCVLCARQGKSPPESAAVQ